MIRKLKILELVWAIPFPPDQGGRIRALYLLQALRDVADISMMCFRRDEPDEKKAVEALSDLGVSVTLIPIPPFRPNWTYHFRSIDPFPVQRFGATTLLDAARTELARTAHDLLIVDGVSALAGSVGVERVRGPRLVYQSHNVESEVYRRCLALAHRSFRSRIASEFEGLKMVRFERNRVRQFSGITAVSTRDAATLQRWAPAASVYVIPNGADCSRLIPLDISPEPGALVFAATLAHPANRDAVCYFAEEIFPRIRGAIPSATWYVIGRDVDALPPSVRNQPGIVCTGYVDDVRPYVARAQVTVVPLRAGGGTRLKILEAMALARPVVSTTVGAEGLDVTADEHLLIADGPDRFAEAVIRILKSPASFEGMCARARQLVLARYDWSAITRRYVEAILEIYAGKASEGDGRCGRAAVAP